MNQLASVRSAKLGLDALWPHLEWEVLTCWVLKTLADVPGDRQQAVGPQLFPHSLLPDPPLLGNPDLLEKEKPILSWHNVDIVKGLPKFIRVWCEIELALCSVQGGC